jgi:membrane-associated phospholipid phosphatase
MNHHDHHQTKEGRETYRVPFTRYTIFWFLIPALIALIEIQFSGVSWNFTYNFLKYTVGFLDSYFAATEQFAADITVIAIMLTVWMYCPRQRHTIVPYLIALLLVSVIVNAIKPIAGRARPDYGWKMETSEKEEIQEYLATTYNPVLVPEPGDYWMWASEGRPGIEFIGWINGDIPWFERNNALSTGDYSSFPSGHSASAILLAAYLTLILPRGRYLWYVLAVGCALSRIRYRRHYPGDTIFGGAIGFIGFRIVFSAVWPFQLGARIETKILQLTGQIPRESEPVRGEGPNPIPQEK